ncbi:unnamed protein product [Vitrella brassicaformis CCMP3155]|uniref:Uncharacterized protein n=1 Tax=Vitrella brassicaformis (strain CCMP3155) TaxID=1169540 RepID=A0A0G4EK24_VITBC|nr:unnamed protein product [Vitrella brassicaformis CCMP3155]|eukprot:CEL97099.1 unnamed protein product [Vitrella brassicaformis CCMP3155]
MIAAKLSMLMSLYAATWCRYIGEALVVLLLCMDRILIFPTAPQSVSLTIGTPRRSRDAVTRSGGVWSVTVTAIMGSALLSVFP